MQSLASFVDAVAGLELGLARLLSESPSSRFIHASLGHEVPAWAVTRALAPTAARWALYYRCHAWLLALGTSADAICAEILGEGPRQGLGGSMHLLLHSAVVDCNSVVGAQLPIAVGAAFHARERGGRVVCVLGDGATNSGVFYEAINIASVHALPLLLVIEDNQLAIGTTYRSSCLATIPAKLATFGVPCASLDAASPEKVLEAAIVAVAALENGPRALHIRLERIGPHALAMGTTPGFNHVRPAAEHEANRLVARFGGARALNDGRLA
jgi:TPP-dependent pyruvate/acetoin dehydrogenase alpha subunit